MVFNISRKYKIQLIYNCYLKRLNELSIPVEVAWYLVRVATRRLQLATWSGEQIWAAEVTATKTMRRARNIILGVMGISKLAKGNSLTDLIHNAHLIFYTRWVHCPRKAYSEHLLTRKWTCYLLVCCLTNTRLDEARPGKTRPYPFDKYQWFQPHNHTKTSISYFIAWGSQFVLFCIWKRSTKAV